MRPTFEMLAFHLTKSWHIRVQHPRKSLGQLPLPMLYDPSIPLEESQIYIASAAGLLDKTASITACCFICCHGEPAPHYNNSECGLIVIDPSVPVPQVFNKVQSIYLLYQDWEEKLQALVGSTTLIQELLDISSTVLENLLCLTDENNNILSSSSQGKRANEVGAFLDVFTKDAKIQHLKKASRQLSDRSYIFDIMQIRGDEAAPEVYFIEFYHGRIHVGTLSMFPTEHSLGEHDKQLLEILALYVQIQLLRPPQIESESSRSMVTALLSGNPLKDGEIAILESALFFDPSDSYRCIVIKLPANVLSKSGTYLQRRIKVEVPASIAIIYEDCLVGLINETKSDWDSESFYQSMKYCLGKTDFFAGISDSFYNLVDLKDYYHQAKTIAGFASSDSSRLITFMDCWDRFVLTNCTNGLPPRMLFTPGLKRLIEHNKTSSVDYIETLRVYLEEGRNDSRSASRLFICRNTFLYRLEKLTSILREDLNDSNVRFRLELCLRLNDMVSK